MRAVVVQHETNEGEGLFGPALRRFGFEIVPRFREVLPGDGDADLVVVLGGNMAAYDEASHPFLVDEVALLRRRLRRDAPCLGICLGAQLMAKAAGAAVFRGESLEIGALPIHWTAAAQHDPVLRVTDEPMVVAHWHHDTHALVPGSVLLASSERYTQQAFRLGRSYAFQFHLELASETLPRWLEQGMPSWVGTGCSAVAALAQLPALRAGEPARTALVERLAAHFGVCRG